MYSLGGLHKGTVFIFFSLFPTLIAYGQVATQPHQSLHSRQEIRVEKPHIVNTGPWTPQTRKQNRPEELWRYYQHGAVDFFTTPVGWKSLIGSPQEKYLAPNGPKVDSPFKKSTQPPIRLSGNARLNFANPIPIKIENVQLKKIRFFIWIKGDNVTYMRKSFHGPGMIITIKDATGNILSRRDAITQTQGTFPYHCYYFDVFIPEEGAGIYITLYNKHRGTAWFSLLSWEPVTDENTYSNDEKQDPYTGSLANNPLYNQLNQHLQRGFGRKYKWRFVLGDKIGLVGHPYDITTKDGFCKYYNERAKFDSDAMNHAIMYLLGMYHAGTGKQKNLPPMEEGWLENFKKILLDAQDPQTGYWHDGSRLSLGLTFHLCIANFRYYGIKRADRPDRIFSGLGLTKTVPRADEIIRTTLAQQSHYTDSNGVRKMAAWNHAAYGYTKTPDAHKQKCWFATTWDAIYLLQLASRYVTKPELKQQAYDSVKGAFRYVLEKCITDDGLCLQRDTDKYPTSPNYIQGIMQDSAWLERKIDAKIPTPKVSVAMIGKEAVFHWTDSINKQNSVRVYAVPAGLPVDSFDESCLIGIIHRTGQKIYEMDPIPACQKIRTALAKRWGVSMELPPESHWRGKKYLPWKLRKIHFPLVVSNDSKLLVVDAASIKSKDVYVTSATWYGEESVPAKPILLKVEIKPSKVIKKQSTEIVN